MGDETAHEQILDYSILARVVTRQPLPRSQVSKTFDSKEQFIGEVLQPFGARFSEPFRPVAVHGAYADGDTVVVLWDGEGTRLDGKPYENTYAWFMRFRGGLVVEATAFFDSIAFDELWNESYRQTSHRVQQSIAPDAYRSFLGASFREDALSEVR